MPRQSKRLKHVVYVGMHNYWHLDSDSARVVIPGDISKAVKLLERNHKGGLLPASGDPRVMQYLLDDGLVKVTRHLPVVERCISSDSYHDEMIDFYSPTKQGLNNLLDLTALRSGELRAQRRRSLKTEELTGRYTA